MPFRQISDDEFRQEEIEISEILESDENIKREYLLKEKEYEIKLKLAKLRRENNISQNELKEKTGLTQQSISRIETSKEVSPTLSTLIKYLDILGYDIDFKQRKNDSN